MMKKLLTAICVCYRLRNKILYSTGTIEVDPAIFIGGVINYSCLINEDGKYSEYCENISVIRKYRLVYRILMRFKFI